MKEKEFVPVTEEEKNRSIYKYFKAPVPIDPKVIQKIVSGPIRPDKVLAFKDRNKLFEEGYHDEEIGWCILPDGTGYVANLVKMPGVTTEMFDWFFAWHGLENLRYKIWHPYGHYSAVSQQKDRTKDPDLSYKEKLWDTSHEITEDTGMGPSNFVINFKYPGDVGFDASKIGTKACSTIVCGKGYGKGQPPFAVPPTFTTHFVRETEDGIELRTRFWMGWDFVNGKDVKALPDGMRYPDAAAMTMAIHSAEEFTNLAAILPSLYAEEKDNW